MRAQVFLRDAAEVDTQEITGEFARGGSKVTWDAADYLLDQRKTGGGNFAEHAGSLRKKSGVSGARDYIGRGSFRVRGTEFHGAA